MPGVKMPSEPFETDSDSIGSTYPLTSASGPIRNVCDWTADTLPLMSTAIHLTTWTPRRSRVSTWPGRRGPWFSYVGEARVGVEPSVV